MALHTPAHQLCQGRQTRPAARHATVPSRTPQDGSANATLASQGLRRIILRETPRRDRETPIPTIPCLAPPHRRHRLPPGSRLANGCAGESRAAWRALMECTPTTAVVVRDSGPGVRAAQKRTHPLPRRLIGIHPWPKTESVELASRAQPARTTIHVSCTWERSNDVTDGGGINNGFRTVLKNHRGMSEAHMTRAAEWPLPLREMPHERAHELVQDLPVTL